MRDDLYYFDGKAFDNKKAYAYEQVNIQRPISLIMF